MIEGTMKCYKCGKRSYDDNACLDEETGPPDRHPSPWRP
jgi:hypothetical protein